MECICFVTPAQPSPSATRGQRRSPKNCEDQNQQQLNLKDIDLCEIVKRSEDENSKHNDHECHLKGERRQNLINKLKMYLDDYDDRPVMKGKGKSGDKGKALGQTGFGPLIKYPGYVDYDHPYFSDPYNKMPTLATTVGQRGQNPCTATQMRNWDDCNTQSSGHKVATLGGQEGFRDPQDGRCHCAERAGELPRCTAAAGWSPPTTQAPSTTQGVYTVSPREMTMTPQSPGCESCKYICIPLPEDC